MAEKKTLSAEKVDAARQETKQLLREILRSETAPIALREVAKFITYSFCPELVSEFPELAYTAIIEDRRSKKNNKKPKILYSIINIMDTIIEMVPRTITINTRVFRIHASLQIRKDNRPDDIVEQTRDVVQKIYRNLTRQSLSASVTWRNVNSIMEMDSSQWVVQRFLSSVWCDN